MNLETWEAIDRRLRWFAGVLGDRQDTLLAHRNAGDPAAYSNYDSAFTKLNQRFKRHELRMARHDARLSVKH